jgi:hypothetical protein
VDLKAQSKHRDKNCPIRMFTKLFEVKKWLNMEPKTDKENGRVNGVEAAMQIRSLSDIPIVIIQCTPEEKTP